MSKVTITNSAAVPLPMHVRDRYGFVPGSTIRVVEMCDGVLFVALESGCSETELTRELAEWQSLAMDSWNAIPYEKQTV